MGDNKYKINNKVYHVNFSVFVNFLKDLARLRNDPSMIMDHLPQNPTRAHHPPQRKPVQRSDISVHKTVASNQRGFEADIDISYVRCRIHGGNSNHVLRGCQKLRKKPYR